MAFGDILSGFAEAGHQYRKTLMQMDFEKRKALAEKYGQLAESPDYPEEARTEFLNRALQIHSLPIDKKLPKEWENMSIMVQPPTGPKVAQNSSIAPNKTLPMGLNIPDFEPPVPPPESRNALAPMSFEEKLRRLEMTKETEAGIERKTSAYKAGIPKTLSPMTVQTPTGRARMQIIQKGVTDAAGNPVMDEAGFPQLEFVGQQMPWEMAHFAIRRGTAIPIDLAQQLAASGEQTFLNQNGQEIDLDALAKMPGAVLKATGNPNEYEISAQEYTRGNVGGNVVAFPKTGVPSASNSTILGPTGQIVRTTNQRPTNVIDPNTKQPLMATTETVRAPEQSPIFGGSLAPTPPPGVPRGTFDPALMNYVLNANPGIPQDEVLAALQTTQTEKPEVFAQLQQAAKAAPQAPPSPLQPTPPRPRAPQFQTMPGLTPGEFKRQQDITTSVRPAATILFGDEANQEFESIQSFANIADDPKARERLGTAARLIIEKLGTGEAGNSGFAASVLGNSVNVGGGGIIQALKNKFGVTQWEAKEKGKLIESAVQALTDTERRLLNRMMAAYGTIVGLRRFTGAGAYQFSTQAMERELPIPGFTGVVDSKTFYNKLASLAEEITAATKGFAPGLLPERPYYEGMAKFLTAKGKGANVKLVKMPNGEYVVARQ